MRPCHASRQSDLSSLLNTPKRLVTTSRTPACQKYQKQPSKAVTSIKKDAARLETEVARNVLASDWRGSASAAAQRIALRMALHPKPKIPHAEAAAAKFAT